MKPLALLVALVIMIVGVLGTVAPDRLIEVLGNLITPVGLYAIAALRVAMGLVLILAASASRAPRTLRVLGTILFVAGLATPLFGVDRARVVADWAAAQGPAVLRGIAGLMLAVGGFIAFAVGVRRRPD